MIVMHPEATLHTYGRGMLETLLTAGSCGDNASQATAVALPDMNWIAHHDPNW